MKNLLFFTILFAAACKNGANTNNTATDTSIVISYDTIPENRTGVQSNPVAEYSEPVKDELNNWKFAVSVYETKKTFDFLVRIQYKEVRVSDSLKIPNFGIRPTIGIHKGKQPLTCIIGFLDQKNQFKEYKKVSFENDQLHVKSVAHYYVGAYKTKLK